MNWIGPKVWVAITLACAALVGCLSEAPDRLTDSKQAGVSLPQAESAFKPPGGGERGNANDNGPNGNDNGGGGSCPDFDGDGAIDVGDLTYVLASFGGPPQSPGVDMNGDGVVSVHDLSLFLSWFGLSCDGNGNDNGVPNGNDNGVPNGNDNGLPNGNDNGVPNGNDNGVPNGNDNGLPNGNDNGVPNGNGNDNGVPNGNDNGMPNGNDNGAPNGNDNGVPNGNANDNGGNGNGNGNDNGACPDGSVRLFAQLSGDLNNQAEYRDLVGGCSRFRVHVRSLAAFTTYTVAINGVSVGTLTTDDRGRGELEYDPLPSGFPDVRAGDVVTVGPVSGVFGDDCSANDNCNG